MLIDLEKYSLKQLGNVADVMSSSTFKRRLEKGDFFYPKMTFIQVPKSYVPKKMEVEVMENPPQKDGYVVISKTDIEDNVYLTCILNSHVAWQYLTNGNLDKKSSIYKKKLETIPVRLLSKELQAAVVYLYYLIGSIMILKDKGDKDAKLEFKEELYRELLDGLVLELTMPKLFKDLKIDLFDSWSIMIGKCLNDHPGTSFDSMQEIIGNEMMNPHNFVTNNMKKLRVVAQLISDQIAKNV